MLLSLYSSWRCAVTGRVEIEGLVSDGQTLSGYHKVAVEMSLQVVLGQSSLSFPQSGYPRRSSEMPRTRRQSVPARTKTSMDIHQMIKATNGNSLLIFNCISGICLLTMAFYVELVQCLPMYITIVLSY